MQLLCSIIQEAWGYGSVGRAIRSHRIGQGFESPYLHHRQSKTNISFGLPSFLRKIHPFFVFNGVRTLQKSLYVAWRRRSIDLETGRTYKKQTVRAETTPDGHSCKLEPIIRSSEPIRLLA